MSETPFMPLWVADFIGDTMDLDAKEVGAYLLLLMAMWGRDGYLPSDQKKLQRVARCGRDWPRIWVSIGHYFTPHGDRITQGRLLKELQKVAAKREVNAQHGALGGRAKALKNKEVDLANATVSLQQPEPEIDTVAKATGAEAPPDPEKVMFDSGRVLLMAAGKSRDAAGKLLGKWKGEHGAGAVIEALGKAQREGAIDPVSFIEGCLRFRAKSRDAPKIGERSTNQHGEVSEYQGEHMGWVKVWG